MHPSSSHSSLNTRQLSTRFPARSHRVLSTRRDFTYRSPSPIEVQPVPGPSRTRHRSPSIESTAPRPYTRRRFNRVDTPVIDLSSDDEPLVPPSVPSSSRHPSSQGSRIPTPNIDQLGVALPQDLMGFDSESENDLSRHGDDAGSIHSAAN